ncbi:MAG: ammonium transporter, partial [Planctomycetota bacterium]
MSRWIRVFLALLATAHLGVAFAQEKEAANTAELKKSITALEAKLAEIQKTVSAPKDTGDLKKLESQIKEASAKASEKITSYELKIADVAKTASEASKAAGEAGKAAGDAGKAALAAKAVTDELAKSAKSGSDIPAKVEALKKDLEKASADAAKTAGDIDGKAGNALKAGDTAWMLVSSAFVMLMVPGLALFYGGMVRKKNVLATMMQSMVALSVVGIYWVAIGYSLAFGPSVGDYGIIGWSPKLVFLNGIKTDDYLPAYNVTVYAHVMFQGMFAIITPALISGALAERIRFGPYLLFILLWVTFVYCPLAHMVWAFDWFYDTPVDLTKGLGGSAVGMLGKMGALDFAGGTVVHIAAGAAALASILVLRKRIGYPEQPIHPNSLVLTLTGAGILWFGWFGFNGG